VGVIARGRAGILAEVGVPIANGRFTTLELILDPDKLARIDPKGVVRRVETGRVKQAALRP
jgi:hypothetical protein